MSGPRIALASGREGATRQGKRKGSGPRVPSRSGLEPLLCRIRERLHPHLPSQAVRTSYDADLSRKRTERERETEGEEDGEREGEGVSWCVNSRCFRKRATETGKRVGGEGSAPQPKKHPRLCPQWRGPRRASPAASRRRPRSSPPSGRLLAAPPREQSRPPCPHPSLAAAHCWRFG